uniref:major histocompatibility complex class II DEB precursor n=1 Tax=Danio rerio TaxID=7955 RepID=UPI000008A3DE|nr:major histocompatibility complex class II DEB precursor [Danio rerio]AAA87895.1 major histocompatibility class II protein [Danio rerio]
MSLQNLFIFHLLLFLFPDGYYHSRLTKCIFQLQDLSDIGVHDNYIFNKDVYIRFNSTLGYFVGYTEHGVYNAQLWKQRYQLLEQERAHEDRFCKYNAEIDYNNILGKTVKPQVKLNSVKQAGGRQPAVLVCSAYDFYPKRIKVTWLRNGKPVTTDVTSTEELADGDWYYQIHSHLEYTPKSGEKISCMVDHASSTEPIIIAWDSSLSEPERNKIAIGASGLVLGIIIATAGLIYYKKKSSGQFK